MSKQNNKQKGHLGEDEACRYLEKLGYEIIERNWHYSKLAEIDIIALNKNTLVFIEVKYRTSNSFGHPLEAVTKNKLQKIYLAIQAYLQDASIQYKKYQLDVIAITACNPIKIEHLTNVALN